MEDKQHRLLTTSVQDLLPSDAASQQQHTQALTHSQSNLVIVINSSLNSPIRGSDVGSGTLTDIDYTQTGKHTTHHTETHVYPRRWWVLAMLCISLIQSSSMTITFSVCYKETHALYGWDKLTVDWLVVWGSLLYIPTALLLPLLNRHFTFRALITLSNLLMCVGAVIRSFPPSVFHSALTTLILAHFGQILISLACPLIFAIPQQLSAIWFPPQQRTIATSMAVVCGYAGSLCSYATIYYIELDKYHLETVLRLEALFSLLFFIIVLSDQIWYDDVPPIPPSVSSMLSIERYNVLQNNYDDSMTFKKEILVILKSYRFHYFTLICGAYQGVISGWIGVLDTIVGPDYIGFSDTYVAIIGMSTVLAIICSGILFGGINDLLHKRSKLIILVLLFISGLFLTLFTMIVNGGRLDIFQHDRHWHWIAVVFCVIGIFANAGTYGLTYEASVELIYPSREVYAGTILTIYFNVFCTLFIMLNNYIDPLVMNWIVCGVQVVATVLLVCHKQEYRRLDYDEGRVRGTIGRTPSHIASQKKHRKHHPSETPPRRNKTSSLCYSKKESVRNRNVNSNHIDEQQSVLSNSPSSI